MELETQKAKAIQSYVKNNPDAQVGYWPLLLSGRKEILPYYKLPMELLRYNVQNGRLKSEIQEWETDNGRELDSNRKQDAKIIKELLLSLEEGRTQELIEDIREYEQIEPGVVTYDGVVINGNRRMAVLELLHEEQAGGKWKNLDAIILSKGIPQDEVWKIEAGLQLSKDKVAPYSPINELLKIQQGINAGVEPKEIASVLYGRTEDEVKNSIERLNIIENFLKFFGQPNNPGIITKFGLHEYFVNIQNSVINPADNQGLGNREKSKRIQYAFALISAHILKRERGKRERGMSHMAIRNLRKIFDNPRAYIEYTSQFGELKTAKDYKKLEPDDIIDNYKNAKDIVDLEEEKNKPTRLLKKAISALESIDTESEHFTGSEVKQSIKKIFGLIKSLDKKLG